ncbi:MAG: c-type cytochrome [Acidimicrobiales bacterium]|nr:cytochrome c [Actinomycetota bacterium]
MKRRLAIGFGGVLVLLLLAAGVLALVVIRHNEPELHAGIEDHFKYGSIGAEARSGIPERIWYVLPKVFPEHLPQGEGDGYARLGFIYEPGQKRPIGTSRRENPVASVGVNCAVCHTGTVRDSAEAAPRIVLGMPANTFDLRGYIDFLRAAGRDPRFNADTLLKAMRDDGQKLSWWESRLYRHFVIPRTEKALKDLDRDFSWVDKRPPWGPGRVDTFNPYKDLLGLDLSIDDTIGTSDLPTIWNQRRRDGMYLHWDGNNSSLSERNKSAAIGAGATPASLDLKAMKRIEDWILDFPPPAFPGDRIDARKAEAGARLYAQQCASCHDFDGAQVGQVSPLADIGTDGERLRSFDEETARRMNTIGEGRPWAFSHFRKTDGYVNMPLDGVWLRAPYLHNGSVPTMRALLFPEERPDVFYRRYDVYDYADLGFVSSGAAAERVGFRFDTTLPGNGNEGHLYGTQLPPADREAILEYLKTR